MCESDPRDDLLRFWPECGADGDFDQVCEDEGGDCCGEGGAGVGEEGEPAEPGVDSGTSPMARKLSASSGRAGPATGSMRLESVVVMIRPASHGSSSATSRVLPEISLKKHVSTATTSFRFRRSHNSGELWGSSLMVRG